MRLWHKGLIHVLPQKQLSGQWRECCLIAKGLHDGNLNHILVNKVKQYPRAHLFKYGQLVATEMTRRGMRVNFDTFGRYFLDILYDDEYPVSYSYLYEGWHNDRYLRQCLFNLEEKYDCGGVSQEEWMKLKPFIAMFEEEQK